MEEQKWKVISGTLKDFDWQLNLALSSDKLATLNQALVNVDFDLINDSKKSLDKSIEMNPEELSTLISAFEEAQLALQRAKH